MTKCVNLHWGMRGEIDEMTVEVADRGAALPEAPGIIPSALAPETWQRHES